MHKPSEVDQNQLLLVRFLNLGSDDVIIPGMANLFFNIELSSTADTKRLLVSNIGRAVIKKLPVKFKGNNLDTECGRFQRVCMLPRPVEDRVGKAECSEIRHNP